MLAPVDNDSNVSLEQLREWLTYATWTDERLALVLHTTTQTLRGMITRGKLTAIQYQTTGPYIISLAEVKRMLGDLVPPDMR